MADPTDRLVAATRRRLAGVTLGLITLLVVAMGVTTAVVGLRVLDAEVDRALDATATAAAARFETEHPAGEGSEETEVPAEADTFVLYLDAAGALIANPSRVPLDGLPSEAAVEAARTTGEDLRDVVAGGVPIRLETLAVSGGEDGGGLVGFVQAGFVLTLHDQQSARLVAIVTIVDVAGLVGAAFVAFAVTGRALVPIRRTLAGQQRFVADASHELRTPATLIRSAAEILEREDLVRPDGPAVRRRHRRRGGASRPTRRRPAHPRLDGRGRAQGRARRPSTWPTWRARRSVGPPRSPTSAASTWRSRRPAGPSSTAITTGSSSCCSSSSTTPRPTRRPEAPSRSASRARNVGVARRRGRGPRRAAGGTGACVRAVPSAAGRAAVRRRHRPGPRDREPPAAEGHEASISVDDAPDGGARFTVTFAAS